MAMLIAYVKWRQQKRKIVMEVLTNGKTINGNERDG